MILRISLFPSFLLATANSKATRPLSPQSLTKGSSKHGRLNENIICSGKKVKCFVAFKKKFYWCHCIALHCTALQSLSRNIYCSVYHHKWGNFSKYVCVPMPTHCTITCFGIRTRRMDGIECGLFSIHTLLGQTTLRVGRVSV